MLAFVAIEANQPSWFMQPFGLRVQTALRMAFDDDRTVLAAPNGKGTLETGYLFIEASESEPVCYRAINSNTPSNQTDKSGCPARRVHCISTRRTATTSLPLKPRSSTNSASAAGIARAVTPSSISIEP